VQVAVALHQLQAARPAEPEPAPAWARPRSASREHERLERTAARQAVLPGEVQPLEALPAAAAALRLSLAAEAAQRR